jgi:integrase
MTRPPPKPLPVGKRRGRPENPTLVLHHKGWRTRVWVLLPSGERKREWVYFPARDPKTAQAQLRQLLRKPESERIDVAADPVGALTFKDLAEQWTSGKLHDRYPDHVASKKRSVRNDVIRLGKLYATIGGVPLVAFTVEHAERAMANLPPTAKASATRRHYAQLIARVLALAVYPCKILERSPLPRGFLPKVRTSKSFQWLRPAEELALVTCPEVPFERRVLYWFLAREGCRLSEALALRWRNVAGRVVQLGITKTNEPRTWAMRDDVALGLAVLRGSAPDDAQILVVPGLDKAARRFREDLLLARVKRPELHERAPGTQPIRLHDLRATFVTLALAAGKSETWVADRTGHRSSIMINRRAPRAPQRSSTWASWPPWCWLGILAQTSHNSPRKRRSPSRPHAARPPRGAGSPCRTRTGTPCG